MGTEGIDVTKTSEQGTTQQEEVSGGGQVVGSPVPNRVYNVITALQAKLEGLEAYRKYSSDSDNELWQELARADVTCVKRLVDQLSRFVEEGALRIEGGEAHH